MSKPKDERYTIAVDFDGVIHSYTSPWVNAETIPDPPVEGAIEWLNEMAEHFSVYIHTTRAKTEAGLIAVSDWLCRHGMQMPFSVTAEKPAALIYLDDRAYRFEGPGTFPSKGQIFRAIPWNKKGSHG